MSEVLHITPGEDDEKVILRRLLKLYQDDEIENIKEVRIFCCVNDDDEQVPFTENMASDIIRTFRHISSKGTVWNRLHLEGLDRECPHFQSFLSQICKLELFREIALDQYEDAYELGELTERAARDISDAMKNNTKLEKISIDYTRIPPIISSVLCEGLKTENQNLTELSFYQVDFGEASLDQSSAADAVSHLVTGLHTNKNLKHFSFSSCNVSDHGVSRIMKALEGHPTLEHLEFDIWSPQCKKTLESLRGLLSLPTCNVNLLKLTKKAAGTVIDLDLLLEGLKQNKSLRRLSLNECFLDDGDLSKLLRNLWDIRNLTHLDLSRNDISKFSDLDASVFDSVRQSRLRCLNLVSNPIMWKGNEEDQSSLLRLLKSAPQLGYVARPFNTEKSDLFTPLIRHYLDWNRCGRVLTTDHNETALPVSMWPLVFARANIILQEDRNQLNHPRVYLARDFPDRRPNVIYQLFHGFLSLHSGALSNSHFIGHHHDDDAAAEPEEKRQRLI